MLEVVTLLVVLILSLLITKVATVMLTLTGLSRSAAQFQARSAMSGAGFTTSESEAVVNHPLRRRIVMWLMLIGNGGLVVVAALLILTIGGAERDATLGWRMLLLLGGLVGLWLASQSQWVDRRLSWLIERLLRRLSDLDTRDYVGLLRLRGEYQVVELLVAEQDWIANRELKALKLPEEGVLVLGIIRPTGKFLGTPPGDTVIRPNDTLLLYGRETALAKLDTRNRDVRGHLQRVEAVAVQKQVERSEKEADASADKPGEADSEQQ